MKINNDLPKFLGLSLLFLLYAVNLAVSVPLPTDKKDAKSKVKYCTLDNQTCSVRGDSKVLCDSRADCRIGKACGVNSRTGKAECHSKYGKLGQPKDECTNENQCKYNECDGFACIEIVGEKIPENHINCAVGKRDRGPKCKHIGCSEETGQCEELPGIDPAPGVACEDKNCYSTYCTNSGTCKRSNKSGDKKCSMTDPNACTHLECAGMTCKRVAGSNLPSGKNCLFKNK